MKKIVFDFAGVLFHWQPATLLQRELPHIATDAAAGQHWAAQIFQGYGGDWAEFDRGTVSPEALAERIAARCGLALADAQRVIAAVPHELQPMPDTLALLQRLQAAGCGLYFLSNMPAPYADALEAWHPFIGGFAGGVFSSRVRLIKPEAAIYALAAGRFDAAPGELMFIDDHLPNVLAARESGWNALHFSNASATESDLRAAGWM